MPKAYFNENDPYAAQWLRNLIAAGHIAPGDVDQRSIEDVAPLDLAGYTQCHFFAGVGVWSYALRRAGWPDSRPVWTGSCPCQPFSAAGKGNGFADERHLWPAWLHLIGQRSPVVVFGEQVSSKDADVWVDLVQTDMEALGYAFGAVPFPSAGVGAPHIRDRLYWLADSDSQRQPWVNALLHRDQSGRVAQNSVEVARGRQIERVDNTNDAGLERFGSGHKTEGGRVGAVRPVTPASESCRLADTPDSTGHGSQPRRIIRELPQGVGAMQTERRPTGPVNGRWSDADWLFCRDGKWRPVESRPQPLVDGSAESLGRVRSGTLEEIEGEINASSMESQIRRPEVLRALQDSLISQAQRCWATGRLPQLHEAPFLLAFLRQLQTQGWPIAQDKTLLRQETSGANVRMLRNDSQIAGAPREYGLDGQSTGEYTDAVHFLSSLLARHAHSAWGHAYETYAEIGFPLHRKARSRVGRLRAYGNAINAAQAQIFIETYLECKP